jgi:uncharacterized protein (TIGR02058 family)
MMRTFVVELGTGVDLHGKDSTSAAIKAVRDCFAHVSLPGLRSVAGLTDLSQMQVDVILGAPAGTAPIDTERVAAVFPHGKVNVAVEPGGLLAPGGGVDPTDQILIVNAVLYVRVE